MVVTTQVGPQQERGKSHLALLPGYARPSHLSALRVFAFLATGEWYLARKMRSSASKSSMSLCMSDSSFSISLSRAPSWASMVMLRRWSGRRWTAVMLRPALAAERPDDTRESAWFARREDAAAAGCAPDSCWSGAHVPVSVPVAGGVGAGGAGRPAVMAAVSMAASESLRVTPCGALLP